MQPVSHKESAEALKRAGLEQRRLFAHRLGRPPHLRWRGRPPWLWRIAVGSLLWVVAVVAEYLTLAAPTVLMWGSLIVGLVILQAACDALITATERLAARKRWDHYLAGTLVEIFSTLPEFVVIAFVAAVSPLVAVITAFATIYNNALVFSLYSSFLPKDEKGKFVMPVAITEAGTQVLIAGAAIGSVLGLHMVALKAYGSTRQSFASADLIVLGVLMWAVFGVYLYKLVTGYAKEEEAVHEALNFSAAEIAHRRDTIYAHVERASPWNIAGIFSIGIVAAFLGGERVSSFAEAALADLGISVVATAIILAGFAGMSEYVILWRAHRKGQYRIALANAFGGITQVMFLVVPFTLLIVGIYQALGIDLPDLPLQFSVSLTFLAGLLFPTFYVLIALLEEDHTFGVLDTAIMTVICLLVLLVLLVYGA
ncbi:MAG: sodium/calcium exchanger protein, partial [Gammaproteobacteria bacterium]